MLFPLRQLARRFFPGNLDPDLESRVEALLPYLYKLALGLVGKAADAEDLVHDTCVKTLMKGGLSDLKTEQDLKAWMRIVLINQFRDNYRREQKSPKQVSYLDIGTGAVESVETLQSTDHSPEDAAIFCDLESAACRAVAALPREVREVVALYMIGDRSYREIAALVDCPLGTVMSRLARGRRLLRSALQCYLHVEGTCGKRPAKAQKSNRDRRLASILDER